MRHHHLGQIYRWAEESGMRPDELVETILHRAVWLKSDPAKSNRRMAEQVKVDHKTVAAVRTEMEGRGEIPHVETRADSKGRPQPATRSQRPAADEKDKPEPEAEPNGKIKGSASASPMKRSTA